MQWPRWVYQHDIGANSDKIDDDKIDWNECIDAALYAYRIGIQDSSKFSPFFLMYNRQPRKAIDHEILIAIDNVWTLNVRAWMVWYLVCLSVKISKCYTHTLCLLLVAKKCSFHSAETVSYETTSRNHLMLLLMSYLTSGPNSMIKPKTTSTERNRSRRNTTTLNMIAIM